MIALLAKMPSSVLHSATDMKLIRLCARMCSCKSCLESKGMTDLLAKMPSSVLHSTNDMKLIFWCQTLNPPSALW